MDRARNQRTWVEVSRSALRSNVRAFEARLGSQAKIAPVIKANGYGHGMAWLAETLRTSQIWGFCVAYGSEALDLASVAGRKPILVLSAWQADELPELIQRKVRLVVWDLAAARAVVSVAKKQHTRAFVHIKLDTGTSRIGARPENIKTLIAFVQAQPSLIVDGLFSHYADSEGESLAFAKQQQAIFNQASTHVDATWMHMACTAASLRLPLKGTNLMRLGIGLYGLWPSGATQHHARLRLKPVLAWKTRVLQVKTIPAGTSVGYGRTFTTRRSMTLATLPIGYSDGYDRRASNRSWVMVRGIRCPVVGRVSMNLTMVNASRVRPLKVNDEVTLIGTGIDAGQLAETWGTLHYEVVSRINPLIPRIPRP